MSTTKTIGALLAAGFERGYRDGWVLRSLCDSPLKITRISILDEKGLALEVTTTTEGSFPGSEGQQGRLTYRAKTHKDIKKFIELQAQSIADHDRKHQLNTRA